MVTKPLNFVPVTSPLVARPVRTQRSTFLTSRRVTVVASAHTLNGRKIAGPLQPANQNLLVRIAEASEKTTGGIFLPNEAKEKPTFGEVVEAGPGKYLGNGVKIPMHIAKGDMVMYGKYGGTDLTYDENKHTIVTQDDVLCKFKDGDLKVSSCEPIFDRVLVKIGGASEQTSGGILLSSSAQEKQNSGTVVNIGPGRFMENGEMEPLSIAVGDEVYYGSYAGTNITLEGEEYIILRVADIFAKV